VTPPPPVIRVGSGPQAANCIKCPAPEYPDLARKARVQDTVVLQALINKEGTIEGLSVVTGNQLFHKAALEAVRQWKYRPTLLNGEPVAVQTTISIAFVLK
jgi:protein TonB